MGLADETGTESPSANSGELKGSGEENLCERDGGRA